MKKQLSTFALTLTMFGGLGVQAQKLEICNTFAAMEQRFAEDPQAKIEFQASQAALLKQREQMASFSAKGSALEFTVPVVFHVLYDCGVLTVSDAELVQALKQVNDDFARLSTDTNLIFKPFKSLYIPSDIKFMLAKKDPQGNCTNGIVRHIDAKHNWSQLLGNQAIYWPYTWDPTRYLNIYIVTSIISANPQPGVTTIGYTYLPGTWPAGNVHDAIVYDKDFLVGGNPLETRHLSHEIGHWLNLEHTFGFTNSPGVACDDDGIADTPPTKGEMSICPASTTNTNLTCAASPNNYYSNVENIMNYASCPRNFTAGQTAAMRTLLQSPISNRQNVISPSNLIFTGINNTNQCIPTAEFFSNTCGYTVCAGQSLTFKDASSNAAVTSYSWQADNFATVAAPTSTQTSITFQLVGTTNVTLTATNSSGSHSRVRTITVEDPTPVVGTTYFESFEMPGIPPFWQNIDVSNDSKTWQQTNAAAFDAAQSYYIDGSINPPGASDILMMPMMDVKNNPGYKLEFAYAYAQENTAQNDVLKIQGSRDCGGSWADIISFSAPTLASGSGGQDANSFFPAINQWKTYDISAHPNWLNYTNSSSVLVRFNFIEGTNGYGNNIFLDAIGFKAGSVGINELTKNYLFGVYPNPTTGEANIHFNLNDGADVKITVVDLLGRPVAEIADQHYSAGEQTISINKNDEINKGIYFVNMSVNGALMSSKLVID